LGKAIISHLGSMAKDHKKIILYANSGTEDFSLGFLPMTTAMAIWANQERAIETGLLRPADGPEAKTAPFRWPSPSLWTDHFGPSWISSLIQTCRTFGPVKCVIVDPRTRPSNTGGDDSDLTTLLNTARARGAFAIRSIFDPPWSWRIADGSPLTVLVVGRGRAWVVPDDGEPVELKAGDVAIVRDFGPYTVAHDPLTRPTLVIEPGPTCKTILGHDVPDEMHLDVRTWGTGIDGEMKLLTASYQMDSNLGRRLLRSLPDLLVVRGGGESDVVALLDREMSVDGPGQQAFLDRLVDLLLIAQLRTAWSSGVGSDVAGWGRALADPIVGPALRAIQDKPAEQWTVARLARHVGASRSTLARRFVELVGEPPISFLTSWRLSLASDLLLDSETTIGAVASKVGYGSPYALSTAFKRHMGVSPSLHREVARAG
jgi:AraC-like DNA-binding protein